MIQKKNVRGDGKAPGQARTEGEKKEKKTPILKPMLPPSYERMLRAGGDDKDLVSIEVQFFPKGLQEIYFQVRKSDDSIARMTTGEYQAHRHAVARAAEAPKAEEAAIAFFRKLEARCWIKCSNHSAANARRVKAIEGWPAPIVTIMGLTQKDIKSRKLTPQRVFQIWKEFSISEKEIMNKFQQKVDPVYVWTDTLINYSLFVERAKRDEEQKVVEKIKEMTLQKDKKWGDVEQEFLGEAKLPFMGKGGSAEEHPTHNKTFDPFDLSGEDQKEEHNDDGPDGLSRAVSPKPVKEEAQTKPPVPDRPVTTGFSLNPFGKKKVKEEDQE